MQRQNILVNLTVQFPNPVQQPQWGAPVLLTQVGLVVDDKGTPLYQPAFSQMPAAPTDITEEILVELQTALEAIGLKVERVQV